MARDVKVNILGDASKFNQAVGGMGRSFLAIGAGAAAAGAALFKVGQEFDSAYDKIRIGTGATGAALEALKDDFREVARTVPASFDDIGSAIADVNTRLGLTGPELQAVSTQLLNLSRLTDTDLTANIEGVTRLFGDWAVATENQVATLDMLFRASQATGPSVEHLSRLMVQFGAPMRQLGFSIEQTAALLGSFEKEGVNTELVMGSLRQALGRMAREGEPAIETFNRVVDSIAAAGSASEANRLALELFGARAGPDMAAAIREGRFAVDDLVASIAGSGETINGAANDTNDFSESWQLLVNNLKLAIEEPATTFFNWLSEKLLWLAETGLPTFMDRWETFKYRFTIGSVVMAMAWNDFYEDFMRGAVMVSSFIQPKWDALWAFFFNKLAPILEWLGGGIMGKIQEAFSTAAWVGSVAWLAVYSTVKTVTAAVEWLIGAVRRALDVLRQLKDIASNTFTLPGGTSGMTSWLNVPNIPGFDSGGVMPGPRGKHSLAWVAGGETILPTHKSGSGGAGPTTIVLQVGSTELGRVTVDSLKAYERSNGPLPLRVA